MSRYCELKLVDVLEVKKRNSTRNRNACSINDNTPSVQKYNKDPNCKNKRSNPFVPQINTTKRHKQSKLDPEDTRCNNENTRFSKRLIKCSLLPLQNSHKEQLNKNTNIKLNERDKLFKRSGSFQVVDAILKSHSPSKVDKKKKQSQLIDVVGDILVNKKFNIKNVTQEDIVSNTSGDSTKKSKNQKRKERKRRQKRKLFWENKLTGAKRVSKRLSNLKIRNNIVKNIDVHITRPIQFKEKNRESVKFIVEDKCKTTKRFYGKIRENPELRKSVMNRSQSNVQTDNGKLNHAKKVHTRITASRKILKSHAKSTKVEKELCNISGLKDFPVNNINDEEETEENTDTDTQEIPGTAVFSTDESSSAEVSDEQQDSVTATMTDHEQLVNASNVIIMQTDEMKCPRSQLETAKENLESPILYDVQKDCISCPEVIVIDIKTDGSVSCEHTEECELFAPTGENSTTENNVTSSEEEANAKQSKTALSVTNKEPPSCQASEGGNISVDSNNMSNDTLMQETAAQNEHVSVTEGKSDNIPTMSDRVIIEKIEIE